MHNMFYYYYQNFMCYTGCFLITSKIFYNLHITTTPYLVHKIEQCNREMYQKCIIIEHFTFWKKNIVNSRLRVLSRTNHVGPSLYSVYATKHNGFRIHVFSVLLLNTRISVGMVLISGFWRHKVQVIQTN